ncbi:MAG: thermonuclease family protein [Kiritimatiellae bacterium]|nr:thermonuclease family protein [Kiritimatiellia bacterium]
MSKIRQSIGFLLAFSIGICNAEDLRVCFVEYSSVGRWEFGRKVSNETTDICFCDYSSVGRWEFGRKVANETIDVCFVNSPSNGARDPLGISSRNPTLNVHLSAQRTARTHNVEVCQYSSVGGTGLGSAFGRYTPPTTDICLTTYSSVGRWEFGRKIANATTDICICNYSSPGRWEFGRKVQNATTDIYLSPSSGLNTVDLYIDARVTRKQLVAILFKLGILNQGSSAGVRSIASSSFQGKVVDVHDGDTITVEDAFKNQVKVRLAKIDAPELAQTDGKEARRHLCDLIDGTTVQIENKGKDDYGRILAIVYDSDGYEVNLQMVKDGWAWHFKKYDQSYNYSQAEENAKWQGKGIWRYGTPTPPWEWRKGGNRVY